MLPVKSLADMTSASVGSFNAAHETILTSTLLLCASVSRLLRHSAREDVLLPVRKVVVAVGGAPGLLFRLCHASAMPICLRMRPLLLLLLTQARRCAASVSP